MRDERGSCPFCSANTVQRTFILREKPYLVCAECRTLRLHQDIDAVDRTRFYEEEYAKAALPALERPERTDMLHELIRRLGPPRGRRLLDMGAGSGTLVKLARQVGWEAEGTELSSRLRAVARSRHEVDLLDPARDTTPVGVFDWVCLINVLDQASDPKGLLRQAHRALQPAGRLLIRVPNATFHVTWIRATTSLGMKRLSGRAILHDYGFSSQSLRASLVPNGFRIVTVRNAELVGSSVGARTSVRRPLQALFGLIAWLSAHRTLWGPSLEAEADRIDLKRGSESE